MLGGAGVGMVLGTLPARGHRLAAAVALRDRHRRLQHGAPARRRDRRRRPRRPDRRATGGDLLSGLRRGWWFALGAGSATAALALAIAPLRSRRTETEPLHRSRRQSSRYRRPDVPPRFYEASNGPLPAQPASARLRRRRRRCRPRSAPRAPRRRRISFCASSIWRTSSISFCASTSGERVGSQSTRSATNPGRSGRRATITPTMNASTPSVPRTNSTSPDTAGSLAGVSDGLRRAGQRRRRGDRDRGGDDRPQGRRPLPRRRRLRGDPPLRGAARSRSATTSTGSAAPRPRSSSSSTAPRSDARSTRCSAQAGPVDGQLRLIVTRGGRRIAATEPVPAHAETLRVATVTYTPTIILNGVKSLSYAANMQATRLAKAAGRRRGGAGPARRHRAGAADLDDLLGLADGALRTPALADGVLDSITRDRLVKALDVERGQLDASTICTPPSEAFLASTTREVQAVAAIDGTELPAAPGPRTREAQEAFAATLRPGAARGPDEQRGRGQGRWTSS